MSRYVLSTDAQSDLKLIRGTISSGDPARAIAFLTELETTFRRLADMPLIGRNRDDVRKGLGSFVHGNDIVFYQVEGQRVAVVRVVHAKRHLPRLFGL